MKVKCKAKRAKLLMERISSAGSKRTVPAQAGTQREFQLEKWSRRQNTLEIRVVHVTPPGNAPRQQREFQRLPAERVRVQGELVCSSGAQLPIRFFSAFINRDTLNRRVVVGSQAEIQGQPIEGGKPLDICGDQFFVGQVFGCRVVAQVHFQTQLLQAQALHKIVSMLLLLRS